MTTLRIYHGAIYPMVAVGKNQVRLLGFAHENRGWHTAAKDRAMQRALITLANKGYVELAGDQFRFTYPYRKV